MYILTNGQRTLSIGVRNNLERHLWDIREGIDPDVFATLHKLYQVVHIETFQHVWDAPLPGKSNSRDGGARRRSR